MDDLEYKLLRSKESYTDLWPNIELYESLANQGNMNAQYRLARNYIALQKYNDALQWGLKAAEQGQVDAILLVARIYGYKLKKYRNTKEQIKWLEKAIFLGNSEAYLSLAYVYLLESEPYRNFEKGISILRLAVEKHDLTEALYLLGVFDKCESKKWLTLASKREHIRAIISLIDLMWKEEDFQEAYQWILFAENLFKKIIPDVEEEAEIQIKKAISYLNGWGVIKNIDKAKKYLRSAKKIKFDSKAENLLKEISKS